MSCFTLDTVCGSSAAFNLFGTGNGSVAGNLLNCWGVSDIVTASDGSKSTTVSLDGGYKLEFDERNSRITIINPCGVRTAIWGDPHVDQNNIKGQLQHDWGFTGQTSFLLADGKTKITIGTTPWQTAGTTVPETVTVTSGDKSLVVSGLAQAGTPGKIAGDLKIVKGMSGHQLDNLVWDGNLVVEEGPNGGWGTYSADRKTFTQITNAEAMRLSGIAPTANEKTASVCEQEKVATQCVKTTCFSWLEALAAGLGSNLAKQVDKISSLYKALNSCNTVKADCVMSVEEYKNLCGICADGKDMDGWTAQIDASGKVTGYVPNAAAAEKCKGQGGLQAQLQTMLTAEAMQFQLLATMNSTVLNSISQGMQSISRAG